MLLTPRHDGLPKHHQGQGPRGKCLGCLGIHWGNTMAQFGPLWVAPVCCSVRFSVFFAKKHQSNSNISVNTLFYTGAYWPNHAWGRPRGSPNENSDFLGFRKNAKSTRKGESTKNAILWTPQLTPHAHSVTSAGPKLAFLLCRGKGVGHWGVRLHRTNWMLLLWAIGAYHACGIQRATMQPYNDSLLGTIGCCYAGHKLSPWCLTFLGHSMLLDTVPYTILYRLGGMTRNPQWSRRAPLQRRDFLTEVRK